MSAAPASRDALRRRYLSLGLGELAAAAAVVVLAALVVPPDRPVASAAAAAGVAVVLVQAGVYWLSARRWVGRGSMPTSLARCYRAFRMLDVPLLAAVAVVIVVVPPGDPLALSVAVASWVLGVTEYVNYYVVRLAYPPARWWRRVRRRRTPQLVRDIARAP